VTITSIRFGRRDRAAGAFLGIGRTGLLIPNRYPILAGSSHHGTAF
jgi:hypothetical protein